MDPKHDLKPPEAFAYLSDVLELCSNIATDVDVQSVAHTVDKQMLSRFEAAYNEIVARQDDARISEWVRAPTCRPSDREVKWHCVQMFAVFSALAEAGVPPFCMASIGLQSNSKQSIGWEGALREIKYLRPLAEKYKGVVPYEDDFAPSSSQMGELEYVAMCIGHSSHGKLINELIEQFPITDFVETSQIYNLLGIMDQLGLAWET